MELKISRYLRNALFIFFEIFKILSRLLMLVSTKVN